MGANSFLLKIDPFSEGDVYRKANRKSLKLPPLKKNGKNYQVYLFTLNFSKQGPVVQSSVSLTSSLRVISLTVLADSLYNIPIFFAEKMWVAFALQKLLTFF